MYKISLTLTVSALLISLYYSTAICCGFVLRFVGVFLCLVSVICVVFYGFVLFWIGFFCSWVFFCLDYYFI